MPYLTVTRLGRRVLVARLYAVDGVLVNAVFYSFEVPGGYERFFPFEGRRAEYSELLAALRRAILAARLRGDPEAERALAEARRLMVHEVVRTARDPGAVSTKSWHPYCTVRLTADERVLEPPRWVIQAYQLEGYAEAGQARARVFVSPRGRVHARVHAAGVVYLRCVTLRQSLAEHATNALLYAGMPWRLVDDVTEALARAVDAALQRRGAVDQRQGF